MISGSDYPTSNIFLDPTILTSNIFLVELYRVKELLNEKVVDVSDNIRAMALSMSEKFDKYWGESNVLLSIAAILDPRYKMVLIDYAFPVIYGEVEAVAKIVEIKVLIYELYNEYVEIYIISHFLCRIHWMLLNHLHIKKLNSLIKIELKVQNRSGARKTITYDVLC
ncbi:hypothetical protein ACS0TY_019253 [Phlomoides rotata]